MFSHAQHCRIRHSSRARAVITALILLPLLALSEWQAPAAFAAETDTIRRAAKHFSADKLRSFNQQAARIAPDSVYQPMIAYWKSMLALRRKKPAAAEDFVAGDGVLYLQQQARQKLLDYYAKQKRWGDFARHAANGGECARALQGLRDGADSRVLRDIWQRDTRMDDALCMRLYRDAYGKKMLTKDDIWVKLRALAGDKRLGPSRRLLQQFHGFVSYKKLRSVIRRATRYIRAKHGLSSRADRELVMISAMVAARRNPKTAIGRWRQFSRYFSAEENDHVWTVLAAWAARWHRDEALTLYAAISGKYADEQSRAWRVRAALRANDTQEVLTAIAAMPPEEQALSAWRYWHAIAMQSRDELAATAALTELAHDEDDFYGLLAREAVGLPLTQNHPPPAALEEPRIDFKLAIALHKAGLKTSARRMWYRSTRAEQMSSAALIAAADAAAAANWPLASIDAAIRADSADAYRWRFPFPYKEQISEQSKKRDLDTAFVYGLIHQESRFMPKIVSSAKARGLMQVIPSTARLVARANKYTKYHLSRLTRVDTNLVIGTTYLRELAETFAAEPAKVAAAYNAGPTRVRRWYRASPSLLVAIENIPITETRLYVKYLLANRLHYTARLGAPLPTMQEIISRPISTVI